MAKLIKQIIKKQADLTNPTDVLVEGEKVSMLGVQATPGTLISINGGSPIQVGAFGIYELDLTRFGGYISNLKVQQPQNYPNDAKVIIDILYEAEGM